MSSKKLLALDEVRMDLIVMWEQGFEMGAAYGDPGEGGEPDDVPTDWRDDVIERQGRSIAEIQKERDKWRGRALELRDRIVTMAACVPKSEYGGTGPELRCVPLAVLARNVALESKTWEDNDE